MSVLEIDGDCPPDLGAELEEALWSSLHPDERLQPDRIGVVRKPGGPRGAERVARDRAARDRELPGRRVRRGVRAVAGRGSLWRSDGRAPDLPRPGGLGAGRRGVGSAWHHRPVPHPGDGASRTRRRAATPSRVRRPVPARPWASPSPSSSGSTPTTSSAPARSILVPTRELAQQVTEEFDDIAAARGLRTKVVYGGTGVKEQAKGVDTAHILIATPGRLQDLTERRLVVARRRPDPRARRGRPDARHGVPAPGRPDRPANPARTARRCSSRPRSTAPWAGSPTSTRRDPVRHEVEGDEDGLVDDADHRFVPVPAHGKLTKLIELAARRGRAHARVREHEARWSTRSPAS